MLSSRRVTAMQSIYQATLTSQATRLGPSAFCRGLRDRPPRLATDHYGEGSLEHNRRRCCCGGRRAKFTEHGPSLERLVIFLLPCANMSLLRRQLLQPAIPYKGGVVTTDPMAATHCVVAIPFGSDIACVLFRKYGGSPSCRLVPDSFLYQ